MPDLVYTLSRLRVASVEAWDVSDLSTIPGYSRDISATSTLPSPLSITMVALAPALTAGLMLVTARISSPLLTPAVFNTWYSDVHVRDMVTNGFASIALRYTNLTAPISVSAASTVDPLAPNANYLALYNVPDVDFIAKPGTMDKLPLNYPSLPDARSPVTKWSTWSFTYWVPVQTVEGANTTETGRPKYVLVLRMDPVAGRDTELEEWFHKEVCLILNAGPPTLWMYVDAGMTRPSKHLPTISALPGYRRTTRYRSSKGSRPRVLVIHEADDMDSFYKAAAAGNGLGRPGVASAFDLSTWLLFLERGDATEKLGKPYVYS